MSRTYTAEDLAAILDRHGKWLRSEEGGERADLSGANLRGADLREANLREAYLSGANLREANLREAYLSGANLREADLCGANLCEANLSGANLRGADLREASLREAYLSGANLREANLREAYLSGANLREADLCGANLCEANLCEANLREANLCRADLRGANLCEANLRKANLREADLCGANLSYWILPEEGEFIAWKAAQTSLGVSVVLRLRIPAEARRACCYTSRKCRVDRAIPVAAYVKDGCYQKSAEFLSKHDGKFIYQLNVEARPDSFNADPREECTNGIHIFITRKEAEDWA